MMQVEMAICYDDGTWQSSHFIEVPDDTPDELLEETARAVLECDSPDKYVGSWLYHYERTENSQMNIAEEVMDENYDTLKGLGNG